MLSVTRVIDLLLFVLFLKHNDDMNKLSARTLLHFLADGGNYCEYHQPEPSHISNEEEQAAGFLKSMVTNKPLCLFWKLEKLVQWDEVVCLLSVWYINEPSYI